VEGDLTQPSFGLVQEALHVLSESSIIIHTASSINLVHPLPKIAKSVIYPTLELAKLAIASQQVERFVYISTAYANAHLHMGNEYVETNVLEELYPLSPDGAGKELEELLASGSTKAFEAANFPYPYSYAKNLTERLLTDLFSTVGDQLLIIRPSIIGPALREPYPYYEIRGSAPATSLLAACVLCTSLSMTWASPFDDPAAQSIIDEVPVDVVVNRILVHTAVRTRGCIHAVAGRRGVRTFGDIWDKAMQMRALPWTPVLKWKSIDWHSAELHPIARMFKIAGGTSYVFEDTKSVDVWHSSMSFVDQIRFPLFLETCKDIEDLEKRKLGVRRQMVWFFGRRGYPKYLVSMLLTTQPFSQRVSWI
jgi:fatty acyl-CoA reductase